MAVSTEQLVNVVKKNPIPTVCTILCIILVVFLYLRSDVSSSASSTLDQKSSEGRRLAANIKNSSQLDEQLKTVTAAVTTVDSRLVHAGQLATNLQYFYKLEADTNAKLVDLRQLPLNADQLKAYQKHKTSYLPVGYSVAVQGSYARVLDFLRDLESGDHFCSVVAATFKPTNAAGTNVPAGARSNLIMLNLTVELLGQP